MDRLFEKLAEVAGRQPGSIASVSAAGYMTYEDLVGSIGSAALAAADEGIEPGQLIVLTGANPDVQFTLALALLRLGCRVGYNRDPGLYAANGVAVDAVLADAPLPGSQARTIVVDRKWFAAARSKPTLPPVAEAYSMIFSSSGSTGRPKLIEYPRDAVVDRVTNREWEVEIGGLSRLLSAIGPRTGGHFSNCLAILLRGGTIINPAGRDAASIVNAIQLYRPDYLFMAPSSIADVLRVLDAKPAAFEKVRILRVVGTRCSPELQRAALERIAGEIMSFYGSTESPGIAWGLSRDVMAIEDCVGRVVKGMEVAAFGPDGERLPPGAEGEIRVKRRPGTGGRYIGIHAEDRKVFSDGWYATGDIGAIDAQRNLIVRGRATNVIDLGGSRVSPELMEDEIGTVPGIREVAVTGIRRPEGFEMICAAVVSDRAIGIEEINGHLLRRKARWPVQMVKLVPAIPKTDNGKIDRIALKRLCSDGS